MAYYALQSHLTYSIDCWGAASGQYITPIFRIQKRIIRIMAMKSRRHPAKELFKKLGLLTPPACCVFKLVIATHRNHRNLETRRFLSGRETRRSLYLELPDIRLEASKKSPTCTGRKFYNSLPNTWKLQSERRPLRTLFKK